ncbi:hypothetical protein ABZ599_37795 [Streptomyces misionensis]|uniref:hypothetical protein n=1 Tax=Streptomyces misionensis TaxID=67331 RepID=UPI0033E26518
MQAAIELVTVSIHDLGRGSVWRCTQDDSEEAVERAGLDRRGEDHTRVQDEHVDVVGPRDGGVDAGLVGDVQPQPLVDVEIVQRARVSGSGPGAMAVLGRFGGGCYTMEARSPAE